MNKKPSYKELEQKIQTLKAESAERKKYEKAFQEKNKNLEKALFSSNQLIADAETRSYQLELEIQQREYSENINKTLFKISNAINITESLEDLFKEIHIALLSIMNANNFFIALYDKKNDLVTFPYLVDEREKLVPVLHNISTLKNSLTREVIFSEKPLFITKRKNIISTRDLSLDDCLGVPTMSWLGVPLKIKGKVIGIMAIQSYTDPDQYSMTDHDVFVSVSEQVALAIERKSSNDALIESEIKHKTILSSIEDGYCEVDKEGLITFTNESMCKITGYSKEELLGMDNTSCIYDEDKKHIKKLLIDTFESGGFLTELSYRIVRKDKTIRHIGASISTIKGVHTAKTGLRYVVRDIDQRKKYEEELIYNAYHDSLTDLYNRKAFYEQFNKCKKRSNRNKNKIALFFIDIDQFKKVNDTLGHETGDAMLIEIAKRLKKSLRATDFIARIGGDEFTIIVDNYINFQPHKAAQKILEILSTPYNINGKKINYVSSSLGASIFPDDSTNLNELINMADKAMYKAKEKKNNYQFYSSMDKS